MRIVTRPDFDGVVCAVVLYETENIEGPVKWVEPNEIQSGEAEILAGDILANLPYDKNCSMWFDHHYTNRIETPFEGAFDIAPSAAGVVYDYYKNRGRLDRDYDELIAETDKIDSASLSLDEVNHPEKYPYVLLSMTIKNRDGEDENYWNHLVQLLRDRNIREVLEDPDVKRRCREVVEENRAFREHLSNHTVITGHVAVTDFRSFDRAPTGNRFLVYSMFPESAVSVKIRYALEDREKLIVSVGRSIFNESCNVNVGLMLSDFNGGGHPGAGACSFPAAMADTNIPRIVDILLKNENNE